VAVGVDIRDGYVAIKGWTESSALRYADFLATLAEIGVKTVICTDISRDGAMKGANHTLYGEISKAFPTIDFIASGGVSSLDDVKTLRDMELYGAIIGKAYYTGAIDLSKALDLTK
jgi:phosphoribosylformimino-5-aminoimidazole carboxamide ribotide isomerase